MSYFKFVLINFILVNAILICDAISDQLSDNQIHPILDDMKTKEFNDEMSKASLFYKPVSGDEWFYKAQNFLSENLLLRKINQNKAKNVILFLGDGMSIPTLMATRVALGGENQQLSFEKFPFVGLSKTYCEDFQVADSACTATAYLRGIKANLGTIGVNSEVKFNDCLSGNEVENHVESIADWAQRVGKATGLVTTTTVTHASPAGVYANTANRMWENNENVRKSKCDDTVTTDIAKQLIRGVTGSNLDVIMGGGRGNFIPNTDADYEGIKGFRTDDINLLNEWKSKNKHKNSEYIWNRSGLKNINKRTNRVLGLFSSSHMPYHIEEVPDKPRLFEMVNAAIEILSKNSEGYFLFVEGGEIDIGHHQNKAHAAINETVELSLAVAEAIRLTNDDETLIVVTSDHSHTMSISGYSARGNNIFGPIYPDGAKGKRTSSDGLPVSTLNYATGLGAKYHLDSNTHTRKNVKDLNYNDKDYRSPAYIPFDYATHGGDDVAIFANGPWSHLFTGVLEQNVIPHVMAYASCIGKGITMCDDLDT